MPAVKAVISITPRDFLGGHDIVISLRGDHKRAVDELDEALRDRIEELIAGWSSNLTNGAVNFTPTTLKRQKPRNPRAPKAPLASEPHRTVWGWLDGILKHPIVASIMSGVIVLVIVAGWKWLDVGGHDDPKPTPTPTAASTTATPTPAPTTAKTPVTTPSASPK